MYTDCVVSALFLPPKFSRIFRGEVLIEYKGEKIKLLSFLGGGFDQGGGKQRLQKAFYYI